jgi:hypothetical protein
MKSKNSAIPNTIEGVNIEDPKGKTNLERIKKEIYKIKEGLQKNIIQTVSKPNLERIKEELIKIEKELRENIIPGFILGVAIAVFVKIFIFERNNWVAGNMIAALRRERRVLEVRRNALQNVLADVNDLNIVPAEILNLQFVNQAVAEIAPQQATSSVFTPDEEDFLDSVRHIRNSGHTEAIQNELIETLSNLLNITI